MNKILPAMFLMCLGFATRAQLTADFSASSTFIDCAGECLDFTDLTTGGTPTSWQWFFPGGAPDTSTAQNPLSICYPADGIYDVTLIVGNGVTFDTLTIAGYITVQSVPGAFVKYDTAMYYGSVYQLYSGGGVSYQWAPVSGLLSPGDAALSNPIVSPKNTTMYTVTITDANGCSTTLPVTVYILKYNMVFVPSAFSPNGSGPNDVLYVRGNNFLSVHFLVYDRWGEKVFETTSQSQGWDGRYNGEEAAPGVYTYVVAVVHDDGTTEKYAGKVALVR